MPDLSHVANLTTTIAGWRDSLWNEISSVPPMSVGPGAPIALPDSFRNPHGVPYGGMTAGTHINLYEGMETLFTGEKKGLIHAYIVMRCYNDRQPGAIYEDSGKSFEVNNPAYLNANGT